MGRNAYPKDATKLKRARALGFSEEQILTHLDIRYAWFRRCWNEEAGLSPEHDALLDDLIATQLPATPTLSLENGEPIHIPGPAFSLTITPRPDSEITIAIRPNSTSSQPTV